LPFHNCHLVALGIVLTRATGDTEKINKLKFKRKKWKKEQNF